MAVRVPWWGLVSVFPRAGGCGGWQVTFVNTLYVRRVEDHCSFRYIANRRARGLLNLCRGRRHTRQEGFQQLSSRSNCTFSHVRGQHTRTETYASKTYLEPRFWLTSLSNKERAARTHKLVPQERLLFECPYLFSSNCFCYLAHSPNSVSLRFGMARRRRGICGGRFGKGGGITVDGTGEGRACAKSTRSICKAKEIVRASKGIVVTKIRDQRREEVATPFGGGGRLTKAPPNYRTVK